MYCNNCGEKLEKGSLFCPNCGEKIEQTNKERKIRINPKFIVVLGIFTVMICVIGILLNKIAKIDKQTDIIREEYEEILEEAKEEAKVEEQEPVEEEASVYGCGELGHVLFQNDKFSPNCYECGEVVATKVSEWSSEKIKKYLILKVDKNNIKCERKETYAFDGYGYVRIIPITIEPTELAINEKIRFNGKVHVHDTYGMGSSVALDIEGYGRGDSKSGSIYETEKEALAADYDFSRFAYAAGSYNDLYCYYEDEVR